MEKIMKESKIKCARCGKNIEPATFEQNIHNLVMLGWRTASGTVTNERYDICAKCADAFEEWIKGK